MHNNRGNADCGMSRKYTRLTDTYHDPKVDPPVEQSRPPGASGTRFTRRQCSSLRFCSLSLLYPRTRGAGSRTTWSAPVGLTLPGTSPTPQPHGSGRGGGLQGHYRRGGWGSVAVKGTDRRLIAKKTMHQPVSAQQPCESGPVLHTTAIGPQLPPTAAALSITLSPPSPAVPHTPYAPLCIRTVPS